MCTAVVQGREVSCTKEERTRRHAVRSTLLAFVVLAVDNTRFLVASSADRTKGDRLRRQTMHSTCVDGVGSGQDMLSRSL